MMDKIVVLSHDTDLSATSLQIKLKSLTGMDFKTVTEDDVTYFKYGSVVTTTEGNQSESAICLCVGNGDGWKLKVNSKDVELKVEALTYDKRIYRPGQLDIRLSCTESDNDIKLINELKNQLYNEKKSKRSSIYFLGNTGDDLIDVCNNYYVHDFSISNEKNEKVTFTKITLHCYSPDNLLTIDKYSKVYCGEGFDTKLFNEMEKKPNNLNLDYDIKSLLRIRSTYRYFKRNDPLYQYMQKLDKESVEYINLYRLIGDRVDGELEYSPVHFPYLVQYNESFYDFLRRIAVRCGEFLYYEKGKLTLGIASENQKRPDTPLDSTKFHIQFPKVNISTANDSSVKLFANSDFVPRTEEEKETYSVNGDKTYNMEYTNDDFVKELGFKDNDSIYGALYAWEKFTYGSLGAALTKATSAETAASAIVTAYVSSIADAGINKGMFEDEFEDYFYKYKDMMGLSNSSMLTNKFYYNVEMQEKVAQDGTIKLNYSSNIPQLYLCDPVDLDKDKECYYYVSHIHGSIEPKTTVKDGKKTITYSRENYAELIPTLKREDETIVYSDETQETLDVYTIVPPHYDIPRIRRADPQEAIVKQVDDPRLMGRVRVLYRWQNEEKKEIEKSDGSKYTSYNYSPWLKVTVPYSGGNQGGMNMMPEIDDHVMVNFVGGNVDNPYVEGYLFYEISRPPMGAGMIKNRLKAGFQRKVISSAKGHAITFTDITDKSSILNMVCPPAAAIANMVQGIGKQWCGKTDSLAIDENWAPFTGGITLRDPNGVYELDLSAKTRSINVKSPFGNVNISAFTGITIDAPNGDINIRGKNVNIEAGNNLTLMSGTNIRKEDEYKVKPILKSACGPVVKAIMGMAWNSITSAFPWAKEITKLTDVSFLRSTWEIIIRPVEGTLRLQSKRNTIITAGKGRVVVPNENLSDAKVLDVNGFKNFKKNKGFASFNERENLVKKLDILALINALKNVHNNAYATYKGNMLQLQRSITNIGNDLITIQNSLNNDCKSELKLTGDQPECLNAIFAKVKNKEELEEWAEVFIGTPSQADETKYNKCVAEMRLAIKKFDDIKENSQKSYIEQIKKTIKENTNIDVHLDTSFVDSLWEATSMFNVNIETINSVNDIITALNDDKKKTSARKLIYTFITECLEDYLQVEAPQDTNCVYDEAATEDPNENTRWTNFKNNLKSKIEFLKKDTNILPLLLDKVTFGVTNFAQYGYNVNALKGGIGKLVNWNGVLGPRSIWGLQQEGGILLSSKEAYTMRLKSDGGNWESSPNGIIDETNIASIKTALDNIN